MTARGKMHLTATIERGTESESATGQISLTWAETAKVECALMEGKGGTRILPGGEYLAMDAVAYFPGTADIRPQTSHGPGDRVKIDGVLYAVKFISKIAGRDKIQKAYLVLTTD